MAWPRYKVVKREGSQVRVQVQVQAIERVCVREWCGVVWCGAYCILHVISHTNTRAATNGGTAADGIATLASRIMDV
jgi:hypothetical protein